MREQQRAGERREIMANARNFVVRNGDESCDETRS